MRKCRCSEGESKGYADDRTSGRASMRDRADGVCDTARCEARCDVMVPELGIRSKDVVSGVVGEGVVVMVSS